MLNLSLEKYHDHLDIRSKDGKSVVFDPVRKKKIILQPEELVRQLVLHYFLDDLEWPLNHIKVEKGINVLGFSKRVDILLYNKAIEPFILVECKSFETAINQKVLDQIARYNLPLKVPYLVITNGKDSYFFEMNYTESSYKSINSLPSFS